MVREQQPALYLFAAGLVGMGLLSVISHDFAYDWQPVPAFPCRDIVAVVTGLFMIAVSVALLSRPTSTLAARALLPFLLVWQCLKIPIVLKMPQVEGVWVGFGEVGMLLAGGLTLFARLSALENSALLGGLAGQKGVRIAQVIFGLAVIPVGLGHLFYPKITTGLIPTWLPFREALALLTGVAQIICGLCIAFAIQTRLAALVESILCALFAWLVWGPDTWFATVSRLPNAPSGFRFPFTAFLITWVVGAAALLIANNSRRNRT